MLKGQIIKLNAGVYTVETPDGLLWQCRARGVFRNQDVTFYVGDFVEVSPNVEDTDQLDTGTITALLPRKNSLIRPPVANIDYMIVTVSTVEPLPNYLIIDKFIATMEFHSIKTIVAITKPDLGDTAPIQSIYEKAGYSVFVINNETGEGGDELKAYLGSALCVFSGNSGAGKSSILNSLDEEISVKVGETSKKLGRGRHTTRHVEIFTLENGLRIADTPGFSSVSVAQMSDLTAEDLDRSFIEFVKYIPKCKFNNCYHIAETGCGVKEAVESGLIGSGRYESYKQIYDELKEVKSWERR